MASAPGSWLEVQPLHQVKGEMQLTARAQVILLDLGLCGREVSWN